jgi:PAS domain S-box-containing protein
MIAFAKDSLGRYVYVNDACARELGREKELCLGLTDRDLFPPEIAAALREQDLLVLETNRVHEFTDRLRIGTEEREYLVFKFPVRHARGEVLLGATAVDITFRQQAAAAIARSEERYRELFEEAPVALHEIDVQGRLVRVNRAECALLGYAAAEMLGNPVWQFVAEAERSASREAVFGKLNSKSPLKPFLREYERKDGTALTVEIHETAMFDPDGQIIGIRSCILDRTELVKASTQLDRYAAEVKEKNVVLAQALQAAHEAAAMKSQLLANMSHEIRTPMNGIVGTAELLMLTPLNAEQEHHAKTVLECAEHLLHLINDILDLSKLEAGKLRLQPVPFSPGRLANSVIDLLRPVAAAKNLDIRADVRDSLPAEVIGDPDRIRQVLTNLLGNAVKFTDAGTVRLTVRAHTAGSGRLSTEWEVSDTGPGIPASVRERLFQPFVQADGSSTRRHGGSGLGLAICAQLVQLMSGTIDVYSSDSGTRLTVALPLAAADGNPRPACPETGLAELAKAVKSRRVLIVEDNPVNSRIARRLLEHLGYRADSVNTGVDAVAAWSRGDYDLILMDCQMPGVDGYEATRIIRARETPGDRTPIIALTANAINGDREKCLQSGMDDYLSKPVRAADLGTVLKRWAGARDRVVMEA